MEFVVILALLVGLIRVAGVKTIAFQAVAHLYVGGMIGAACLAKERRWAYITIAVVLSVLEVICFFALS